MSNRIETSRSRLAVRRLFLLAGTAAAGIAWSTSHGAIINWASAIGGTTSDATKWSPALVPAAVDDLVFNASAGSQAYAVSFVATTPTSRTIVFNEDTVTVDFGNPHTTTNGVTISSVSGDNANVVFGLGTWTSSFNSTTGFDIGDVSGAVGTLTVSGNNTDLLLPGTSARIRVGVGGTGTLNINNQGFVDIGNGVVVASNVGSTGTLLVTGALAAPPFGRSTLRSNNAAGFSHFGSSGNATVTISSGALVDVASDVFIAQAVSSTTTTTVGGAGGLFRATLDVGGDLFLGSNDSAGNAAGTGTLNANNGGDVLVGGALHVGDDATAGTGTLNIASGGLVSAANVIDGALGTINHNAGTLQISGGTYSGFAIPLAVTGTGSPTLRFSSNAAQSLVALGGVGLRVGDDIGAGTFTGNLLIDSGADVTMSGLNNDINMGDDAGTTGTITVTGAGSRLIANQPGDDIRVGNNGTGTMRVESGGQVLATSIEIPASSLNGHGTLGTDSLGAPTITTANLSVGNGVGGAGTATLSASAVLNATNPGTGILVRTTGVLALGASATINASGSILLDGGRFDVGGTVHVGTLLDVDRGLLASINNAAVIDGRVGVQSGGVVEVISGDLTMGKAAVSNAVNFNSGSALRIGAGRTLTIATSGSAGSIMGGMIDMQGGTLATTPGSLALMNGNAADQLTGFGTITSNFELNDLGVCTPTGTGLAFHGRIFLSNATDVAGTAIRLSPTATLEDNATGGGHVLNCKFTADAGSVMTNNNQTGADNLFAFGPLTMGDGTIAGVTLNGIIHMGTNGSLTLNDLNGVALGTLTDMNGGIISSHAGIFVATGRVLQGRGTIACPALNLNSFVLSGGTIDPDAYFSDTDSYHGVGQFAIDGRYTQQASSTYLCEIAGFNNEFQPLNDRIDAGPAALNGTLRVSLIDGYIPNLCDEFTILNYTTRTGVWSSLDFPPGVDGGVRYEATRAVVFFNSVDCDGIDFNNDGVSPDTDDITAFLDVFAGGTCPTCNDIDFNNDCVSPDSDDVTAFLNVFAGGAC